MANRVVFRDLSKSEISRMLARNNLGRIAFSLRDRVDVEPIHYVHDGGSLYLRTSEGAKLGKLRHNQWVAFEVDEVADAFEWSSVVVHGSVWILNRDNPRAEKQWQKALALVSRVVPASLTQEDPVAFRDVLFRIAVNDVRGRCAKSKNESELNRREARRREA